jgi:hypothetical protein
MHLEIILICGLIVSLQQLRIIDLKEDKPMERNLFIKSKGEEEVK